MYNTILVARSEITSKSACEVENSKSFDVLHPVVAATSAAMTFLKHKVHGLTVLLTESS